MFTILWNSHTHSKILCQIEDSWHIRASTQFYKDTQVENKDGDKLWW